MDTTVNEKIMAPKSKLISGQEIADVEFFLLDEKKDQRGSFVEIFQKNWESCIEPVQWSVVRSSPRVFRGMHLHQRHDEYFSLITGHCLVGLKDIRSGSPTNGEYSLYELFGSDMAALTFPRGIIHGWYFFESSAHIQAVSESYIDYGKDDNWGCKWNAPDLNIPWPMDSVILSGRASEFPTEAQLRASLGASIPTFEPLGEVR